MKRILTVLVAMLMMAAMMVATVAPAFATHRGPAHGNQTVVQECETQGGSQPPGQQPVCKGQGLTQEEETLNRGGNAPRGQQ